MTTELTLACEICGLLFQAADFALHLLSHAGPEPKVSIVNIDQRSYTLNDNRVTIVPPPDLTPATTSPKIVVGEFMPDGPTPRVTVTETCPGTIGASGVITNMASIPCIDSATSGSPRFGHSSHTIWSGAINPTVQGVHDTPAEVTLVDFETMGHYPFASIQPSGIVTGYYHP
jgi:hypothetical protein